MCMSDRSKGVVACAVAGVLLLLTACSRKSPEELLKTFSMQALTALYINNDIDEYMQYVDFDGELDSVQQRIVVTMYNQFLDYKRQVMGEVTGVRLIETEYKEDSVQYVHFQVQYADSTTESGMMKVIRDGDGWKVRGRN